jgi:hypothetical protein
MNQSLAVSPELTLFEPELRASAARSLPKCRAKDENGRQGRAYQRALRRRSCGSDAPSPCARKRGRACLSRPIFCDFAPTPASGAARMSCPPPHTGGATILSRLGLDQSRRASRKPETNQNETPIPSRRAVLPRCAMVSSAMSSPRIALVQIGYAPTKPAPTGSINTA